MDLLGDAFGEQGSERLRDRDDRLGATGNTVTPRAGVPLVGVTIGPARPG